MVRSLVRKAGATGGTGFIENYIVDDSGSHQGQWFAGNYWILRERRER